MLLAGGIAGPGARAARPAHGHPAHAHHVLAPVLPAAPSGPPAVAPLAVADMPPPPALADQASYVLMDAATGAIIAEKVPDLHWPPASLAKLMAVYLTYQRIAAGGLKLDQAVPVSVAAWRTGGSRMFISPATQVTVDQLLHGLIIDSGNDAAVALAQAIAGTRGSFVRMMNATAARLGLANTHYTDVDGLPDPAMYSSARDIALLSRAILRRFPQVLRISARKHYTFDKIRQRSWNPVLFHDPTVDGLKTGRTDEAGHCIDATAVRGGRRLIAVVLGGPSWSASTKAIEALLDYGYQFYTNATVAAAGRPLGTLTSSRWKQETIAVGAAHDVVRTLPTAAATSLQTKLLLDPPQPGGFAKGAVVGRITVSAGGKTIATVPAVALAAAQPAGLVTRLMRSARKLL
ncbi:MAG: D-alanyl-D-alanine carboxypeptidase [Rhodospirillales bacterium]|nr:D-alanyl-D-alanine carboxypeptidase [Rhodospirillales bacterium]